jgi:hypothetical protein
VKSLRTAVGIVFGAALGLVFGQMLFDDWWLGPKATDADSGEPTKDDAWRIT